VHPDAGTDGGVGDPIELDRYGRFEAGLAEDQKRAIMAEFPTLGFTTLIGGL
jgi:hypothetical protein